MDPSETNAWESFKNAGLKLVGSWAAAPPPSPSAVHPPGRGHMAAHQLAARICMAAVRATAETGSYRCRHRSCAAPSATPKPAHSPATLHAPPLPFTPQQLNFGKANQEIERRAKSQPIIWASQWEAQQAAKQQQKGGSKKGGK